MRGSVAKADDGAGPPGGTRAVVSQQATTTRR